jgi:UDP-N-acetylmuramate dehydrogenase
MDGNVFSKLSIEGCRILKNEPLSKHCSFKIGGPADYFIEIPTEKALFLFLTNIGDESFYVLGRGTNVLFPDHGYRGIVISLTGDFERVIVYGEEVLCGSGALLSNVLNMVLEHNLIGLEFVVGIPGTVGGAVCGNAGLATRWISSVVKNVEVYKDIKRIKLENKQIAFSYRKSNLGGSIVLNICLSLKKALENDSLATISENIQNRLKTQPLNVPNAGSIFKNPKGFSAGKLVEDVGLKGARIGGAQVSELHGNFIVNTGGASSKDVLDLIKLLKENVYKRFNIKLETEIKIINEYE